LALFTKDDYVIDFKKEKMKNKMKICLDDGKKFML